MNKLLSICCLLLLAACGGQSVETAGSKEQAVVARPAPTAGCAWQYRPLWGASFDAAGCAVVQACPGTVLAPLSDGSSGSCELPGLADPSAAYCDDAPTWQVHSLDEVVLWQRAGEANPPQYGTWPCAASAAP